MGRKKTKSDASPKYGGNELVNRKKDGKKKVKPPAVKPNPKQVEKPQSKPPEESNRKNLFGVLKEFFSFENTMQILFQPCSPRSLAVARILFGLMMIIDIPDERGLFEIDIRYGNPMKCHFPLFNWLSPLPLEYMGLLYFIMWIGAAGICVGYHYQTSCIMFALPYWYIFLLDKTTWNNHSYLYGLLSILFTFCSANHAFSLDAKFDPSIRNKTVPSWNYAILRFQFFLLYFYAGIKKFDLDWIGGHSMTRLSLHWVFDPFRLVLTDEQIDYWIIHIFGFLFDLTIGFFLLIDITRPLAIVFSSAFHLMNSRLFHIGQFPYVCLCMTPIFCHYDWPYRLWNNVKKIWTKPAEVVKKDAGRRESQRVVIQFRDKVVACFLAFYVALQLFLPFSHFITKGYNNWTNGLYGYSWDMMVHNWDSVLTVIKVVDNDSKEEFYIDPQAWVLNSRFSQHGDMLVQYADCIKRNLPHVPGLKETQKSNFENISMYVDSWCSLNGRFQQRMFDPRQDLLKVKWSPFEKISWLMPLLTELTPWRQKMSDLEKRVLAKMSEGGGVLFVADFPNLHLSNYIVSELTDVKLTVLQGSVILEKRGDGRRKSDWKNQTLHEGDVEDINTGQFHRVHTISKIPSCYMYSFINETLRKAKGDFHGKTTLREYDTFLGSLKFRMENLIDSLVLLINCFNKILFGIPMHIRMD